MASFNFKVPEAPGGPGESDANTAILKCNLEALAFSERETLNLSGKEAAKEARSVLHFLFSKLDKSRATTSFRSCWPVDAGTSDKAFREVVAEWIGTLRTSTDAGPYFDDFVPQVLLYPRHKQHMAFLANFSTFVLYRWLARRSAVELLPTTDAATLCATTSTIAAANATLESKLADVIADQDAFLQEQEDLIASLEKKNELLRQKARSFKNLEAAEKMHLELADQASALKRLPDAIDQLASAAASARVKKFDGLAYAGGDGSRPLNVPSRLDGFKQKAEELSGRLGHVDWSRVRRNTAETMERTEWLKDRLDSILACSEHLERLQLEYGQWADAEEAVLLEGQPPLQVELPNNVVLDPANNDFQPTSRDHLLTEQEVEDTLALILEDFCKDI
ncbi:unnamed protein product [Ixodes hexagonus]